MNFRKSLTGQAIWVGLGQLITFSFGILSSAVLSRVLDMSEYGTYKQVMYAYNTLLIVFTLGLPRAYSYFLPKVSIGQAKILANKITKMFFILGLIFSSILYFFSSLISEILNNSSLEEPLKMFSIVPIFLLPAMGVEGILATYKKTELIALYNILTRTAMLVCVVLPVYFYKANTLVAIQGFVVSSFFSFVFSLILKNRPFKTIVNNSLVAIYSYKAILKFSIPLLFASFWGIILQSADQFFVSRYFGADWFAIFSNGALELPIIPMIIGATVTVLTPEFSRLKKQKNTERIFYLWHKVFVSTAKIIYPLLVFFIVFADDTMLFLYGVKYQSSATFFRIFLIVNFFTMVAYSPLIIAMGKTSTYSKAHMLSALLKCLLSLCAVFIFDNIYVLAWSSVLSKVFLIFYLIIFIAHSFQRKILDLIPIKNLIILILVSVISIYITSLIIDCFIFSYSLVKLVVSAIIYGFIYLFLAIRFFQIDYLSTIKKIIKIR